MTRTPRTLDPQSIRCATRATATTIRRHFRDCLIARDDARSQTMWYSGDAPQRARRTIERRAFESHRTINEGYGQQSLTDSERAQIDFRRTNVFHARSVKAIACTHDVGDWIAHYDVALTVSEHEAIYQRTGARGMTLRETTRWCI